MENSGNDIITVTRFFLSKSLNVYPTPFFCYYHADKKTLIYPLHIYIDMMELFMLNLKLGLDLRYH